MKWIAVVVMLGGCADLPTCPQVEAVQIPTQRGAYYVLSEPNLAAFWNRAQGMAKGECSP